MNLNDDGNRENSVITKIKDKIPDIFIFKLRSRPSEQIIAEWIDENIDSFLSSIPKTDSKIVYLTDLYCQVENEELAEYQDKVIAVEIGFYYNRIYHFFKQKSSWYDEFETEVELQERKEEEIIDRLLDMDEGKKKEIVANFDKLVASGEMVDGRNDFYGYLVNFESFPSFIEMSTLEMRNLDVTDKMEELLELASDLFVSVTVRNAEQEEKRLLSLVENCIVWAKKRSISTMSQGDISVFLDMKKEMLSPDVRKRLLNMVKCEMKSRKGSGEFKF